jgi:hypothetical protein
LGERNRFSLALKAAVGLEKCYVDEKNVQSEFEEAIL